MNVYIYIYMYIIRLYATGTTQKIDIWDVKIIIDNKNKNFGDLEIIKFRDLHKHTDICRDIIIIDNKQFNICVSCGMDKNVYIWDLLNFHDKGVRRGHKVYIHIYIYIYVCINMHIDI
jgi:WD40 repeat protein